MKGRYRYVRQSEVMSFFEAGSCVDYRSGVRYSLAVMSWLGGLGREKSRGMPR